MSSWTGACPVQWWTKLSSKNTLFTKGQRLSKSKPYSGNFLMTSFFDGDDGAMMRKKRKNQIQIKTCWKICLRLCFSMYFKCLHGSYMCWSMQVNIFPRLFVSKVWVICRNFLEKRLSSVQIYNEITVMETINKCLILLIPGLLISTRRMSYSLRISWSDWQH